MSGDAERKLLEWVVSVPYIGGREPLRCAVCRVEILTPNDLKSCRAGLDGEWAHKTCWDAYTEKTVARLCAEADMLRSNYAALKTLYEACQELRYVMRDIRTASSLRREAEEARGRQQWRRVERLLELLALDEQNPAKALQMGTDADAV